MITSERLAHRAIQFEGWTIAPLSALIIIRMIVINNVTAMHILMSVLGLVFGFRWWSSAAERKRIHDMNANTWPIATVAIFGGTVGFYCILLFGPMVWFKEVQIT